MHWVVCLLPTSATKRNNVVSWDDIRKPHQRTIQNLMRLVDRHSELWVLTGDPWHKASYDRLTERICTLKEAIKIRESKQNTQ